MIGSRWGVIFLPLDMPSVDLTAKLVIEENSIEGLSTADAEEDIWAFNDKDQRWRNSVPDRGMELMMMILKNVAAKTTRSRAHNIIFEFF
jgi:hypothetical protein